MSVDVEERLRNDLPRLADLLAERGDGAVYAAAGAQPVRRRRVGVLAVAAAVVMVLVALSFVAVADHAGDPTRRIRTTPARVSTAGWTALPPSGLGAVENVAAVWTGSEVLVWGGNSGIVFSQYGAAYDPATDTWRKIAPNQWAGPGTMSTWTGDRLVVVAKRSGAAYAPATDTWTDLPYLPDGVNSGFAGVVWSGTDIYGAVWGEDALRIARYEAPSDRWTLGAEQTATAAVPAASGSGWAIPSVATWFDGEVYVWAGDHGWAYSPERDDWRSLPVLPASASGVRSVLTVADDHVVAVYVADRPQGRVVGAMRLGADGWTPVGETSAPGFSAPVATGVGTVVFVVDADGGGTPLRLDLRGDDITVLDGIPLTSTGGATATWAGNGLFVWGGLTSGPAAAWYAAGADGR